MTPWWELYLYPELRQVEQTRRSEAMRHAKETPFDGIELVGLAAALIIVVSLTRYSAVGLGMADRFGAALGNFVLAIPLLLVIGGPFYVRRTRRGLRAYIARQSNGRDNA